MIVRSSTYRQRSNSDAQDSNWNQRIESDPRNLLYSRFPRHRLEAEVIRDSMLATAGLLNLEGGGEGVMPLLPEELLGTLLKGQWKTSESVADHFRRSIYVFARRNLRYPILESFDRPDAGASCAKRDRSTTAIQALQMLNSQLSLECSSRLQERILKDSSISDEAGAADEKVELLFRHALSRRPTEHELKTLQEFIRTSSVSPQNNLLAACLAVFHANEFIYVD